MKITLRQELTRHRVLLISLVISISLLVTFLIFQYYELKVLVLDIKWLILSGIPILIGLFIGGYIKSFKGFGLELESNLKEPIPLTLISKIDLMESPGLDKQSLSLLYNLQESERNRINRLRFVYGLKNYYDIHAIYEHFNVLRNIKFVEVVNTNGEFICLLPANQFNPPNGFRHDKAEQFVRAIEMESIDDLFPNAVKDFLLTSDSIIIGYKKISKSQQRRYLIPTKNVLPILDDKSKMVGIVDIQKLEEKIAAEVSKNISE